MSRAKGRLRWREVDNDRHQYEDDEWGHAIIHRAQVWAWVSNIDGGFYSELSKAKRATEKAFRKRRRPRQSKKRSGR